MDSQDDVSEIKKLGAFYEDFKKEVGKVIVGQDDVIEKLAICLFAGGHSLLMGVPGLAKTLLVSTIAKALKLDFSRIQFTPDLMPTDITGTDIIQEGAEGRQFKFVQGPIFGNIVLADEINRAPAKTQSALLEGMQERSVTAMGKTYELPKPFFVLATQNPIEQEGTYRLPEAQLDRFMFFLHVEYPTESEELKIAMETTGGKGEEPQSLLDADEILNMQQLVRKMPVPDHIYEDAVRIVRLTRPDANAPEWVKEKVSWGAGPRAVQNLILASKARAALHGKFMVSLADLKAVLEPVLTHRIALNFSAQAQGETVKDLLPKFIKEAKFD